MTGAPRAVFDCVVFVQAFISGSGPSAACVELAKQRLVSLAISPAVLRELGEVPLRTALTNHYRHLTPIGVQAFVQTIEQCATLVSNPPHAFDLPRDRKDEPYVDLSIAFNADYLVTWNRKHLTYLMEKNTPEGQDFCSRFPNLTILSPPDFLSELRRIKP